MIKEILASRPKFVNFELARFYQFMAYNYLEIYPDLK